MNVLLTQLSVVLLGIGIIVSGFMHAEAERRVIALEERLQGFEILEAWAHQHDHEGRTIDPILPYVDPQGHR